MSSTSRQFFKSDDLKMIGRVLDRAKFYKSVAAIESEARLDATRFLIANFQRGATDELDLQSRLANRSLDESEPDGLPVFDTAGQASNTGILLSGPVSPSHPDEKRIESKASRTIYRVLTGVPANAADCEMVQLDVKTTVRALKILNAPEPETGSPQTARSVAQPVEEYKPRTHVPMAERARAFDKYD